MPGTPAVGPVVRLQRHQPATADPATMDRPVRRLSGPHRGRLHRAAAAGDPRSEQAAEHPVPEKVILGLADKCEPPTLHRGPLADDRCEGAAILRP